MRSSAGLLPVSYSDQDESFSGLITPNYQSKLPGVMILPAWMGIDEEAKTVALNLQAQGYIAFVADIYGAHQQPKSVEQAASYSNAIKKNYKDYQHRISLALHKLIQVGVAPDQIAIIGYCFGGTGALEAFRGQLEVRAVVCIHGGLYKDPSRRTELSSTKVLIQHPAEDNTVLKEDLEKLIVEMEQSHADWQLITYGNSKHTFTNPLSADYDKTMADRAWKHLLLFLEEVL